MGTYTYIKLGFYLEGFTSIVTDAILPEDYCIMVNVILPACT